VIFTAIKRHLELIKQGGKVWNRWRETASPRKIDLSGANLRKVDLRNVDFSWANLMETNLMETNLSWSNFTRANLRKASIRRAILREANLSWANLSWVDLRDSYLRRVNLRRADLSWANLKGANLREADLREANLSWADLREANLREADLREANLKEAYLSNTDFSEADLGEANLEEADLRGGRLFKANLSQTRLSGCHIYGISAWNVTLDEGTEQSDLVITDWDEPIITVDNLEVAQFFYLLLHNKKIRSVIDTISSQIVLILGGFVPERKTILDTIREELRERGYLPVFFDCQKPGTQNFLGMISILARMARFIIADFTGPKIVLQIVPHIVRTIAVPVQPLLIKGTGKEPVMISTLRRHHSSVLDTYWYTNSQDLLGFLEEKVILSAEAKVRELKVV
jgi:uncharacterized protein YjbI with pentapeptide repeats